MDTLAANIDAGSDHKLALIAADGLGMCHATNLGAYESMRNGLATTASLQVPCPWSREAAATYRGDDVGVALTLTAEFELYRWGPITHAPSLLGGDGGFPRTAADLWDHADPAEVRRECRAQIERAVLWGFDVTHLTSHNDVMLSRPELFDVLIELAVEFELPIRMADPLVAAHIGFPIAELATQEGVRFPRRVIRVDTSDPNELAAQLLGIEAGITEFQFSPGADSPELRAAAFDSDRRVRNLDVLSNPAIACDDFVHTLRQAGITLIGYRDLRNEMRFS